tara:strand:- start:1394 stop:1582 length:189 start_codon:yes stop_codon:yes gene_type:complete
MTISYKLLGNDPIHNEPSNHVLKKETVDGKTTTYWIPKIEENRDYQAYLEWLSKGNKPEEAD